MRALSLSAKQREGKVAPHRLSIQSAGKRKEKKCSGSEFNTHAY